MAKNLFIFILILNSCGLKNSSIRSERDSLSRVRNEHRQAILSPNNKMADSAFLTYWKKFSKAVKSKNYGAFQIMSYDSVRYEDQNIGISKFIQNDFSDVFDDSLINKFTDIKNIVFLTKE